jgi:hypothetical protein
LSTKPAIDVVGMLRDITVSMCFNPSIHQHEDEQKANKAGFYKVTFDTRGSINPFPCAPLRDDLTKSNGCGAETKQAVEDSRRIAHTKQTENAAETHHWQLIDMGAGGT